MSFLFDRFPNFASESRACHNRAAHAARWHKRTLKTSLGSLIDNVYEFSFPPYCKTIKGIFSWHSSASGDIFYRPADVDFVVTCPYISIIVMLLPGTLPSLTDLGYGVEFYHSERVRIQFGSDQWVHTPIYPSSTSPFELYLGAFAKFTYDGVVDRVVHLGNLFLPS